jgi:hypothetical protein
MSGVLASWRSAGSGVRSLVSLAVCAVIVCLSAPGAALAANGWSAPLSMDGTNPLHSVSCPSASFCMAVDSAGNAVAYQSGSWATTPAPIDPSGNLSSVSCPSASFCMAVDEQGNALSYNGTKWSIASAIDTNAGADLVSVSCAPEGTTPATGFCVALSLQDGDAVIYQDGTWGKPALFDSNAPVSVSCSSASFCMAVDFAGNALTYVDGKWSAPVIVAAKTFLISVSCSSSSFCAAVGTIIASGGVTGNAYTYDGTAWSAGKDLGTSNAITEASVSCSSEFFCQAFFGSPDASAFDGTSWNAEPAVDPGEAPASVSCPLATFCQAVDNNGSALTFTATVPVPVNSSPPTITGSPVLGQTLTDVNGVWSNHPNAFTYRWEDCDLSGGACVPITGVADATQQSYVVQPSDVGHTIEVSETAANDGGPGKAASSVPTAPVAPPVPVNSSPPTITGSAVVGQTLTDVNGTWSNSPNAFAYQWEDCDSSGASCVAIAGATNQTYVVGTTDVGQTIRVLESASNAGGAGVPVQSAQTTAVPTQPPAPSPAPQPAAVAPASAAAPKIEGKAMAGNTLSATAGTWSGTAPFAFSYQWQRCEPSCANVPGATSSEYELGAADVGAGVRVAVTAANQAGRVHANSAEAGPVIPSAAAISASLRRQLKPRGTGAKIATLLSDHGYALSFRAPSAGTAVIDWYHAPKGGHQALIAVGRASFTRARTAKLEIRLTSRGKRVLTAAKRLNATVREAFTPPGADAVSVTGAFVLER